MHRIINEGKTKAFFIFTIISLTVLLVLLFHVKKNLLERKTEITKLNDKFIEMTKNSEAGTVKSHISTEELSAYILSCVKKSNCNLIKYSFDKEKNKTLLNITLESTIGNLNQFYYEMQKYNFTYKYINLSAGENEVQVNLKVHLDEVSTNEKERMNLFYKDNFCFTRSIKKAPNPKLSVSNGPIEIKNNQKLSNAFLVSKVLSPENEICFWVKDSSNHLLFLENVTIEKDEKSQLLVLCNNEKYLIKK